MNINIYQGKNDLEYADINIIIDVIRAFSVSFFAFKNNVQQIKLIDSEREALLEKQKDENSLLSGEVAGYKIDSFDYGNSPYDISQLDLSGKTLIQKTTNGVSVTLASLNAEEIIVTGFNNAYATAQYIKNKMSLLNDNNMTINIIASHPDGEDDLACAEYIKNFLLEDYTSIKTMDEETSNKILNSHAAKKFLDISNKDFFLLDLLFCATPFKSDFIMEVKHESKQVPKITKRSINDYIEPA